MTFHETCMLRCIQLAKLGAGYVAPNPMVGAVLVYNEIIIGEGYHKQYGKPHAEVNCINSVAENDLEFVPLSTLYVSLEPCTHFGKTPPCSDLVIEKKIPKVVVGCCDPFVEVNGKGVDKLRHAGITVLTGILEKECANLNKRFFTFHNQGRPFIILKWAQSNNCKIANEDRSRVHISNEFTNRMVHQWRGEEAAILVGTNTAMLDNPALNVRLASGENPVRLVIDRNLRLHSSLCLFDQTQPTIVFNQLKHEQDGNILFYKLTDDENMIQQVLFGCHQMNIQSIIVEGGARLLQSFIDEDLWDEAWVITNDEIMIRDGLQAPHLKHSFLVHVEKVFSDSIRFYNNPSFA